MINITMLEFMANPKKYLSDAAGNDDFFTIQTELGKVVVISEAEWDIVRDALKVVISHK